MTCSFGSAELRPVIARVGRQTKESRVRERNILAIFASSPSLIVKTFNTHSSGSSATLCGFASSLKSNVCSRSLT